LTTLTSDQTANTIFAGPTSGAADAPAFRAIEAVDLIGGVVISDLLSSRPSPGNLGRFFYSTDSASLYFDTGSAWVPVTPAPGTIVDFGASTLPGGYVACDGTSYSQTGQYADLYAAIGSTWNTFRGQSAPATGQFRVPKLNGLVRGAAGSSASSPTTTGRSATDTAGEETHTLTTTEMPSHTHNYNLLSIGSTVNISSSGPSSAVASLNSTSTPTTSAGSGSAHNTMQPTAFVNAGIKL
ncbi:MAG TPA: phage tail protein, partial [Urbifossiella sp.]|nr:phage tail protein [Urbifossiella sp.]